MRRLPLGDDESPLAAEAARLAGWLSARTGATVTVLHVEQEAGVLDALLRSAPASADAAAHAGGELVRAQMSHAKRHVEVHTAAGDPSETLAAAATADLVLVEHHGRSGLAELVAGSVAKHLVAAAAPPVRVAGAVLAGLRRPSRGRRRAGPRPRAPMPTADENRALPCSRPRPALR